MLYAVHPGKVRSAADGQEHYVGAAELVRLYELKSGEYIVWDDTRVEMWKGRVWGDYLHLHPSPTGRYGRPEAP